MKYLFTLIVLGSVHYYRAINMINLHARIGHCQAGWLSTKSTTKISEQGGNQQRLRLHIAKEPANSQEINCILAVLKIKPATDKLKIVQL